MHAVQVVMFDIQQRTTLGELSTPFIKYVVWSADMNHVALLSKHAIIIANKKLGNASTGTTSFIPQQTVPFVHASAERLHMNLCVQVRHAAADAHQYPAYVVYSMFSEIGWQAHVVLFSWLSGCCSA